MADFLPWFPFDFDAFMEGTPGWTWDERGAYLTLLREQWRKGYVPNAPNRLHNFIAGMSAMRFKRMWSERIAEKFHAVTYCNDSACTDESGQPREKHGHADRLINDRMADDRTEGARRSEQGRSAGLASAAAKANRRTPATEAATDPATPVATGVADPVGEMGNGKSTSVGHTLTYYTGIENKKTDGDTRTSARTGAERESATGEQGQKHAQPEAAFLEHCRRLAIAPERAGVVAGETIAHKLAALVLRSAPSAPPPLNDPARYATRACEAFDAYRASCTPGKAPDWRVDALELHWGRIGRFLTGADPWPQPFRAGAPAGRVSANLAAAETDANHRRWLSEGT